MKIAVFLDVDQVLTKEPINIFFARALGRACETAYRKLDEDYHNGITVSQQDFNARFVPLFNQQRAFSERWCKENVDLVELRSGADELLRLEGVDIFLVSSGPSFYIDRLARKYGIPAERVYCTSYSFSKGKLAWKHLSGSVQKAEFVKRRVSNYRLTVGVGDNVINDKEFLTHCHLRVIVPPLAALGSGKAVSKATPEFLVTSQLENVTLLVRALAGVSGRGRRNGKRASVFIGSSGEMLATAQQFKPLLEAVSDCHCHLWSTVFPTGSLTVQALLEVIPAFDFAVFFLSRDDQVTSRGVSTMSPRDNVILEYGMALAALSAQRAFGILVVDAKAKTFAKGAAKRPSDLEGVSMAVIRKQDRKEVPAKELRSAAQKVAEAMGAVM